MKHISIDRVLEMLEYNPMSGEFRWKKKPNNRIPIGSVAGFPHRQGYWCISIDDTTVLAHRLAYAIAHGVWPPLVDHRDGDKRNNRIDNLRAATKSLNALNQHGPARSSTGFRGVSFNQRRGVFTAVLGRSYLGAFATAEDASQAYVAAKSERFPEVYA